MADVKLDLEQIPVSPIADYEDLFLLRRKVLGADRTVTKADLLESLKFMVTLNDEPDFIGQIGFIRGQFYISVSKTGVDKWKPILASADFNYVEIPTLLEILALKVVITDNNKIGIADSNNVSHVNRVIGIAFNNTLSGEDVKVQTTGILEDMSWSWDINKPIFFNSNGDLTQVVPMVGFLQQMAIPLTERKISITIQRPVIL